MITAQDIHEILVKRYKHCLVSLAEISKDTANNKSMISCPARFYNYDQIGFCIYKGKDKPKTPDMIFIKNDTVYFVEFKNGMIEGTKYVKWDIKLKAIEGAFIVLHQLALKNAIRCDFSHIVNLNKCYMLIYQKDEEVENGDINKVNGKKKIRKSKGETAISAHMDQYPIKFGLKIYKNTFFYEVVTYTPETFKEELSRIMGAK